MNKSAIICLLVMNKIYINGNRALRSNTLYCHVITIANLSTVVESLLFSNSCNLRKTSILHFYHSVFHW